ncbi:MAG: hypothetical protein V4578_11745 [Pseudomonadota bacterium]
MVSYTAFKVVRRVWARYKRSCGICRPWESKNIAAKLTAAPVSKTLLVGGRGDPSGDVCGALHFRGNIGMKLPVVGLIANWI